MVKTPNRSKALISANQLMRLMTPKQREKYSGTKLVQMSQEKRRKLLKELGG